MIFPGFLVNFQVFLPPATNLGQGYVFTGMCDSVHRGVSVSVHAGIPHHTPPRADSPQEQTPPGSRYPLEQTPPLGADTLLGADTPLPLPHWQSMLGDTVNTQVVCILLECNLVSLFLKYDFQAVLNINIYATLIEFHLNKNLSPSTRLQISKPSFLFQ